MRFRNGATFLLVIAALLGAVLVAGSADAGCLTENDTCSNCARAAMWEAIKGLSLTGMRQANLQLWDCTIDLYHCVLFAAHHEYSCAV